MTTDEALMLEFQRGSRDAFTELFERYRDRLYAFFRRRLESDLRAEDLTQETFLAVIRAAQRYEARSLVRTYLFGIAMKLLFAERRHSAHDAAPLAADLPAAADGADDALWLREALAKLDPFDREVLMLREFEQLSYAEIAELQRVPVNTVRSRLFRARMALKDRLEPASRPAASEGEELA